MAEIILVGVILALGIGAISRDGRLKEDTAIGVIFAGMFALGIAMISTVRSYAVDLSHILFGDVLGVSAGDLPLDALLERWQRSGCFMHTHNHPKISAVAVRSE